MLHDYFIQVANDAKFDFPKGLHALRYMTHPASLMLLCKLFCAAE
jgi:hypothetical protein